MPDSPTYGGTIPPVTSTTVPTTVPTTEPAKPAPAQGLAFTGTDLIGTLVFVAVILVLMGVALIGATRPERRREDLLIQGYGGTAYGPRDEA